MSKVLSENIFSANQYLFGRKAHIHIIDIQSIDGLLKDYLDQEIVKICEGISDDSIEEVKTYLVKFFKKKEGSTIEIGAIAEFFIHLYLGSIGFNQEFLFTNLEELSIKKGFDGYYTFGSDEWLLESKSGNISTEEISHHSKIKEAFHDLKKKIAGKSESENDPWKNAFRHASLVQVGSADDLLKNLKKFSRQFQKGEYHDIKDFNIIPTSTIFLDNARHEFDHDVIVSNLKDWLQKKEHKNILAIALTKLSKDLFLSYLLNEKV